MIFAFVNKNRVDRIFEADLGPKFGAYGIEYVDITNLEPKPELGYIYENGEFKKPTPDINLVIGHIRHKRKELIEEAENLIRRYDNQKRRGIPTTDSEERINAILDYMQELRDFPSTITDIDNIQWPEFPK